MNRKKAENNPFIRDGFWKPPKDMIAYGTPKKTDRQRALAYLQSKSVAFHSHLSYQDLAKKLWESTGHPCRENFSKREARKYIKKFLRALGKRPPVAKPNIRQVPKVVHSKGFLESWEWTTLRYKALQKFGRRCMCCGASPETGAVLHVDHIKPRSKFPHLALDIDNLQILCAACNKGKGNWDDTDFREIETTLTPEQEEHMRSILQ